MATSVASWHRGDYGCSLGPVGRRVDIDDLLDASEVAEMLGLAFRNSAHQYLKRYPDFPRPVIDRPGLKLWLRSEVRAWDRRHRQG